MRKAIMLLAAVIVLPGCGRYTFGDISPDLPVPTDWKCRTVIKNSIDFRLHPSEAIGEIITPNSDGTYSIIGAPVLSPSSKPREENFTGGAVYDSQIDQGASANGNYLSLLTANISSDEKMNVDINDVVHAYVPSGEWPVDSLYAIAATHSSVPRFWIADLYISTITYSLYQDMKGNTDVSAPAFGAGGKVYKQSSGTVHDFAVSAKLANVDYLATINNKPSGGPPAPSGTACATVATVPGGHLGAPVQQTLTFAALPVIQVNRTPPH